MELVRESAEGGHKMLLFSQFTSMLSKIEDRLRQEGISYYVMKVIHRRKACSPC